LWRGGPFLWFDVMAGEDAKTRRSEPNEAEGPEESPDDGGEWEGEPAEKVERRRGTGRGRDEPAPAEREDPPPSDRRS